jgi:hypothetical protein
VTNHWKRYEGVSKSFRTGRLEPELQMVHLSATRCSKVKLSLCFDWAPRHEGVFREWRYSSTLSLTSALDGGEWSASRLGRFTPRERDPGTHWIGGWVGPRAVLDAVVKKKIPSPRRESNPRTPIVHLVAQRCTDWAITALLGAVVSLFCESVYGVLPP